MAYELSYFFIWWLDYDETHMGFRALRVINEDIVAPSRGFPPHSHDNMEILTYIIQGEIQHQDSTGSKVIIKQGDVQLMSAGSGITHSEYNALRKTSSPFANLDPSR